ncbi:unnamed protein product [Amaranthus hypochondriacus]
MDDWDWEVLHDSQESAPVVQVDVPLNSTSASPISSGDGGVIRSDYFSLDSHHNYVEDEGEEEEGESSDNPSWIDPSGSSLVGRGERKTSSCNSDASDASDNILLIQPHTDCSAGHGNGVDIGESNMEDKHEGGEEKIEVGNGSSVTEKEEKDEEEKERGLNLESNEEKKVVWWRVPIEMLRYCVMRVNPVWSLSMAAAAVMGFVLLRRQYLNKVKRKTMGLQLKVTVDDKKVSQFMTRVARLNEAFSVVKRVPIVRPSLPAPGLAPWPVVSMR